MDARFLQDIQVTVNYVEQMLNHSNNDWDKLLQYGRQVMASLDSNSFFDYGNHVNYQVLIVDVLQRLAYHDVDAGGVSDIANWCLAGWLRVLQHQPANILALKGVGQWWLSKAQPCLARIHALDGSSSSSEGTRRRHESDPTSSQDDGQTDQSAQDAEVGLHTADYVEARGILIPAAEYLRSAVEQAIAQNVLTGHLLITAAEAYMSLGNVSYTRVNEQYFRQAIIYLRTASNTPGFPLPAHLQRYLDEYGRYVEE